HLSPSVTCGTLGTVGDSFTPSQKPDRNGGLFRFGPRGLPDQAGISRAPQEFCNNHEGTFCCVCEKQATVYPCLRLSMASQAFFRRSLVGTSSSSIVRGVAAFSRWTGPGMR